MFLPVTVHSQDIYKDMVVDGKKWNYVRWPYGRSHVEMFRGDTIVNGRQCVKFGTTNANDDFYCLCAMYQEGGKVYSIWPGREQPMLEYDFSAVFFNRIPEAFKEQGFIRFRNHNMIAMGTAV